jgi:hypothetical protein
MTDREKKAERRVELDKQGVKALSEMKVADDLRIDLGLTGGTVSVNVPRPDGWQAPEPKQ